MSKELLYLMAMSCVIPAATGIYRFNKIEKKFHPFIYMMVLDVLIETILYLGFRVFGRFPMAALNVYMILNFSLFLILVYQNKYLGKKAVQWMFALALVTMLFNFIYTGTIFSTFFYLLCFVSAAMLIVSIDILSRQVMEIKYKLVNNFWFWFSSFSIVYNALNLLVFGLYFFTMFDTSNGKAIGNIQHFVNVACNIFFAVAILQIPSRKEFFFQQAAANDQSKPV